GDGRPTFFGLLEIPVPHKLIQADNVVSVTYPDTGGFISSVSLRSFVFSTDVRGGEDFRIVSISPLGNSDALELKIVGGEPLGNFELVASGDLATPPESWPVLQGGLQFDASGMATVGTTIVGSRQFLRARQTDTPSPSVAASFDFTIASSDWSGNVDSRSTSGRYWFNNQNESSSQAYIMQLANNGNLVMFHDAGEVDDGPHLIRSVFTVQDAADVDQVFSVTSLRWENPAGTSSESTITGYSGGYGGTVEWTLSGEASLESVVASATTGDLNAVIDTLVWEAPAYRDDIFGATLDDVVVEVRP
ncbi:MAG: hypothetical protein ACR2RV_23080, partial [Verrucomicrobiales bacterium]